MTVSVPNQTSSIENAASVAKIKTELEYFKVFGFSEDQIALDAGSVDEDVAAVHLREGHLGQVLEKGNRGNFLDTKLIGSQELYYFPPVLSIFATISPSPG